MDGIHTNSPYKEQAFLLSSPTRISISSNPTGNSALLRSPSQNSESFPELSSQLSHLLSNLGSIYKEIGYSKTEIQHNESRLFKQISDTFDNFLNESVKYKQDLEEFNNQAIKVLKSILEIIGDVTGIRTISDLYMRNLIIKCQKPEGSLLNTQKYLNTTKDNIIQDYKSKILRYLDDCLILGSLMQNVDNFDSGIILTVPSLEETYDLKESFMAKKSLNELFIYIISIFGERLDIMALQDLSPEGFQRIQNAILSYKLEARNRTETAKDLASKIISLWEELSIEYKADNNEKVMSYYKSENDNLTKEVIRDLLSVLSGLQTIKEERTKLKLHYQEKCEVLWSKLNQDPTHISNFRTLNAGLSSQTIDNYETEYSRLQEIKKEFTKEFIADYRVEIKELWDQLCYTDEERNRFIEFYQTENLDDKVLEKHEVEIALLKKKYETYKPLFVLTQQFNNLMKDRLHLEESSKDSSRLLQRNSHKILMEEEKIRKKLARHLPRVVNDIKVMINTFQTDGLRLNMISKELLEQIDEEQAKLEQKGRNIMLSSRTTSRPPSRAPSAQPSRAASRVPTRGSSRINSSIPSRSTSPIKYITTKAETSSFKSSATHGIQKPQFVRRSFKVNGLSLPKSSNSISTSPVKTIPKSENLHQLMKPPSQIIRSQSSLQPAAILEDEPTLQKPAILRQNSDFTPLRDSNRSRIPVPTMSYKSFRKANDVLTSPLKSLTRDTITEDQENMSMVSEFGDEDKFSSWRAEQLQKLNGHKQRLSQESIFGNSDLANL